MTAKKFKAVGAYVFAGGFAIGMSEKFQIAAHLEDGSFGVETFKANFPRVPVYTVPADWPTGELRAAGVDVVYSNPPCSPWSAAGTHKPESKKEAQATLNAFGLIERLDPTIFVVESVSQQKGSAMNKHLIGQGLEAGYAVTMLLHDAKFMGLPQQRRRLFTVFHKVRIDWEVPSGKIVTVAEALRRVKPDMVYSQPGDHLWVDHIRPGEKVYDVFDRLFPGVKKGRPGFLHQKLRGDWPSPTITGSDTKIHHAEKRRLSPAEAAVLCGYPAGYKWKSAGAKKFQELAKTVTPPAAHYLAAQLHRALVRAEPVGDGEVWSINFQAATNHGNDSRMLNQVRRVDILNGEEP